MFFVFVKFVGFPIVFTYMFFKFVGFKAHEIMEANVVSESLGVAVDGVVGNVRVSPERLSRVIAACKY